MVQVACTMKLKKQLEVFIQTPFTTEDSSHHSLISPVHALFTYCVLCLVNYGFVKRMHVQIMYCIYLIKRPP